MPRDVVERLSPREAEVICLAQHGQTDAAIARALQISEGTVGTYWGRIRAKIGAYPRAELITIHLQSEQQRELDAVCKARDEAEARLRAVSAEEQLFHRALDSADEGVLVVSMEGIVLHANPTAHEVLKYPPGALIGVQAAQVVPLPNPLPSAPCGEGRTMEHREVLGRRGDGEKVRLTMGVATIEAAGLRLVSCYFVESRERPVP